MSVFAIIVRRKRKKERKKRNYYFTAMSLMTIIRSMRIMEEETLVISV